MLSEMAVAIPGVQSFPEFARVGIGHWAGFVSGWLYWYFWVIVVAIEAIAGAVILRGWIDLPVWLIGVGLMAILTLVNRMSAKSYGEFEFWFSSLKVAGIVAFIVISAAYAFGLTNESGPTFGNLTAFGGFAPNGGMTVLAATTSVIFSLVGAEIATIAAAESAEPTRAVAQMTSTVALRILFFYILSIFFIVSVTPWTMIEEGVSPFTTALAFMEIPFAATIMNVIVLIAVLSCLNSGLYVTSRVVFTLAARGDAPQALVAVNRRKVPAYAILTASLFSYIALGASILSSELVFSFLVNASGAIMLLVYLLIAIAHIRIRRAFEEKAPDRLIIRTWFFPWLSYAGTAAICAILIAMAVTPGMASQFWSSLVVAVVVAGLFMMLRRGKAAPVAFDHWM